MRTAAALLLLAFSTIPAPCSGFSVLGHQAVVDDSWESSVVPELRRRFPDVGAEELKKARPFAHGGSHVADLGYFPLGNRTFTDLLHYVRSGDFIVALLASARTVDEYAFALGAAAHYVADNTGHPEATNRAVPRLYPKLRKKYGDRVTYADDHGAHLQTEFRFDVLQMSRTKGDEDVYRHAVGFQVPERVLDEAFHETYALHLDDLFTNTAAAIGTDRFAFRTLIHEATGIAWELYRADIQKLDPAATSETFVANVSTADFEKEFGKSYREPGYVAKFFGFFVKLVPNWGPFKRAPYEPLPADVQKLYVDAVTHAEARYRATVAQVRDRRFELPDLNLDTGERARPGEYAPTDEAYVAWLEKLDEHDFKDVPAAVRDEIHRFFTNHAPAAAQSAKVRGALARLDQTSNGRR
jgi:hypothetical protein